MDRSLAVTTCCFALISLPLGATPPKMAKAVSAAALPSDDELGEKITDTELRRLDNLRHYTVVRKYNLHNSHMEQDAVMTAWYQRCLAPTLSALTPADVRRLCGVSVTSSQRWCQGSAIPHPRWYAVLAELAGVEYPW